MGTQRSKRRLFVLRIDSYEASDTFLYCGNERQNYLYAIVSADGEGRAEIVDSSYRTREEAIEAWPEAKPKREA